MATGHIKGRKARQWAAAAVLSFLCLCAPAGPSGAQTAIPAPPFEADLLRLAEILGTLAHLEPLCGLDAPSAETDMQALLQGEDLGEETRNRLADRYNRAFRLVVAAQPRCTGNSRAVLATYRSEGADLARAIVERFGR
ncbi:MAG: TIGR02301 family protein [Hyphomicrobiaceae bacterium]|nr:TIGR02301 family protein [Hyphomicrobiaceae bacterium]